MAETVRYTAAHRHVYAAALLALVELAREREGSEFSFGPLSLDALEQNGLEVSGADLRVVTDVLAEVPGLVRSED